VCRHDSDFPSPPGAPLTVRRGPARLLCFHCPSGPKPQLPDLCQPGIQHHPNRSQPYRFQPRRAGEHLTPFCPTTSTLQGLTQAAVPDGPPLWGSRPLHGRCGVARGWCSSPSLRWLPPLSAARSARCSRMSIPQRARRSASRVSRSTSAAVAGRCSSRA
jgi:hypothetical protein